MLLEVYLPLAAFQNASQTNLEMLRSRLKKIGVFLSNLFFTIPGVKVFLSERLSQDPLEYFLGAKVENPGGSSENPNTV